MLSLENHGQETSEAKRELRELEQSGNYLFHGSSTPDIQELEPRQSHTIPLGQTEKVPDGEPAISATPYTDIAIFRSMVKGRSSFGSTINGSTTDLEFVASQEALASQNEKGYVYVFLRDQFEPRNGRPATMEWRSKNPVKPIRIIEVSPVDLPQNIKPLT